MRLRHALAAIAFAPVLAAPGSGQQSTRSAAHAAAVQALHAIPGDTTFLCSLVIEQSTGSTVDVHFRGLPGNQAATSGNFVAVWQNSVIPWTVAPLKKTAAVVNGEEGTLVLLDVAITTVAYTVGYGVGPRIADICASAGLLPDGSAGPTDAVTMTITAVGSNSLGIHYHTLAGYLPKTSGNWIGLWRGQVSPYNPPAPVARLAIPDDVTDDEVRIDGIVLRVGNPYTLIYFMGPEMTTAAVMITFVVAAGPPASAPSTGPVPVAALLDAPLAPEAGLPPHRWPGERTPRFRHDRHRSVRRATDPAGAMR